MIRGRTWSSIRAGQLRNHSRFGQSLHRFLYSTKPLSLLPGVGWMDGGCLVLLRALTIWGGPQLRPGETYRIRDGREYFDHGFAWLDMDCVRLIIDGDGVQTEDTLLDKLEALERATGSRVRFSGLQARVVGALDDPGTATKLAKLLEWRFGSFTPNLLSQ